MSVLFNRENVYKSLLNLDGGARERKIAEFKNLADEVLTELKKDLIDIKWVIKLLSDGEIIKGREESLLYRLKNTEEGIAKINEDIAWLDSL